MAQSLQVAPGLGVDENCSRRKGSEQRLAPAADTTVSCKRSPSRENVSRFGLTMLASRYQTVLDARTKASCTMLIADFRFLIARLSSSTSQDAFNRQSAIKNWQCLPSLTVGLLAPTHC